MKYSFQNTKILSQAKSILLKIKYDTSQVDSVTPVLHIDKLLQGFFSLIKTAYRKILNLLKDRYPLSNSCFNKLILILSHHISCGSRENEMTKLNDTSKSFIWAANLIFFYLIITV